jgi:general secretion pathway protein L
MGDDRAAMSIAGNPPLKGTGARAWAGRALGWWLGELRALYEDAARRLEAASGATITIEAGERYWILRQRGRSVGQIDWGQEDLALAQDALRAALTPTRRRRAVVVEIPPECVLSKIVSLPAGAHRELERILEFEIGRHFPFPAERVFFRHRTLPRGAAGGESGLAVEIVAVPRETVGAIVDELAAVGVRPSGISVISASSEAPLFLPASVLGVPAKGSLNRSLAIAVGLLAVTALASWPIAQQVRLGAIEQEIASLKPRAEAALHAREQQRKDADRSTAILRLRAGRPALVAILDALTRELPDGSWLLSLSINGREVVLDGLSPSAATIALALERSANFTGIVFRSPITREPGSGLEHFQLGATLAGTRP